MVIPHPTYKLEIEILTTAFSYIGPGPTSIAKEPLHDSPHAQQTWQVEEHNRVASLQSELERAGVVAVDYPQVPVDEFRNRLDPLVGFRLDPAGAPVKLIKMTHFQIQQFAEPRGNGRLA